MFDADKIADELCEFVRTDSLPGREFNVAQLLSQGLEELGLSSTKVRNYLQ